MKIDIYHTDTGKYSICESCEKKHIGIQQILIQFCMIVMNQKGNVITLVIRKI